MNRLSFYENGKACIREGNKIYANSINAKKLAAYEDTKLTPEEVVELIKEKREREERQKRSREKINEILSKEFAKDEQILDKKEVCEQYCSVCPHNLPLDLTREEIVELMNKQSIDIAAIRARCEAATPGKWKAEYGSTTGIVVNENKTARYYIAQHVFNADAEFIAHARQDIPTLLDHVKRKCECLDEDEKAFVMNAYMVAVKYCPWCGGLLEVEDDKGTD